MVFGAVYVSNYSLADRRDFPESLLVGGWQPGYDNKVQGSHCSQLRNGHVNPPSNHNVSFLTLFIRIKQTRYDVVISEL